MTTPAEFVRRVDPNARRLWEVTADNGNHLSCYSAGKHTLLLVEYPDGNGWEFYVPPTLENSIGPTVTAARAALDVQ